MKGKASLFDWFVTITFWVMGFALVVGILVMVIQQYAPTPTAAVLPHEIN